MYALTLIIRQPLNVELAAIYNTLEAAEKARNEARELLPETKDQKFQITKVWPDFPAEVRAYVK